MFPSFDHNREKHPRTVKSKGKSRDSWRWACRRHPLTTYCSLFNSLQNVFLCVYTTPARCAEIIDLMSVRFALPRNVFLFPKTWFDLYGNALHTTQPVQWLANCNGKDWIHVAFDCNKCRPFILSGWRDIRRAKGSRPGRAGHSIWWFFAKLTRDFARPSALLVVNKINASCLTNWSFLNPLSL